MGAPEQPHLPGTGDEPVEPVTVAGATEPADDAGPAVVTGDARDDGAQVDPPADEVTADEVTDDSEALADGDEGLDAGTPAGEGAEEAPADGAPVDDAPLDDLPADDAPADGLPADDVPADDVPADDVPADPSPADRTTIDGDGGQPAVADAVPDPDTDEIPLAAARRPGPDPEQAPEREAAADPADDVHADADAIAADLEADLDADFEADLDADPAATVPAAVAVPAARPAQLHRPRERARTRLLQAMRPKLNRGQLLAALLCAGLGFGLVTQIQSTQSEQLDALTQADLVRLLQEVNTEADKLAEQEATARDEREKLAAGETGDLEAEAVTRKRLQALGVLAGTLPATGPGIRLTLTDPKGQVDAATLLDALQEVRDAGAEAVQINDVRVVASTSFDDLEGGVRIGGTAVRPPYTYLVIGDTETLDAAMRIPGGVLDVVEQKGGQGQVTPLARVDVTALHRVLDPQYARPAPEASP